MKFTIFLVGIFAAYSPNVWAIELDDLINQFGTLDLEEPSSMFDSVEEKSSEISEHNDNPVVQNKNPKQEDDVNFEKKTHFKNNADEKNDFKDDIKDGVFKVSSEKEEKIFIHTKKLLKKLFEIEIKLNEYYAFLRKRVNQFDTIAQDKLLHFDKDTIPLVYTKKLEQEKAKNICQINMIIKKINNLQKEIDTLFEQVKPLFTDQIEHQMRTFQNLNQSPQNVLPSILKKVIEYSRKIKKLYNTDRPSHLDPYSMQTVDNNSHKFTSILKELKNGKTMYIQKKPSSKFIELLHSAREKLTPIQNSMVDKILQDFQYVVDDTEVLRKQVKKNPNKHS